MNGLRSGPVLLDLVAEPRRARRGALLPGTDLEQPPRASTDVAVETWQRLRAGYLARFRRYEEALGPAPFPAVELELDDEPPVVIDASLPARMVDLYIVHGWSAVEGVRAGLAARVDPAHVDPSGGTVLDPLIEALGYVTFVRNATAVVVQSCLADLEARAARRVQAALTQVADAVEGFRKRLGLKATTVPLSRGKTGSVDLTIVYRATDVGFRATLFRALSEAVRQREKLDRLTASLTAARKRVREEKVSEALARSPYTKAAPRPSPRRQEAERAAATVENLATEAAATLRQMQGVIALSEPVALLALPSMTRWSDPQHMTQLLGETLADVDAQLGRFRVASAELAQGLLPVHPAHEVPYDVVERLSVPAAGPEATVAARALERFDAEPGVLPLLHLQVWSELAGTQEVQPVGLSFSVHHWYVLELATALDAVEEGRRVTAAVMRLLGKATAVVSLTLIFLPPVGAVVRGALFAVDLVLAGYALYRVVSDVRGAATAVAVQAAGGASFETMSAIAELCAFRRDVMAALPAQALLELAALALGEASRTVRKLLLARAYYADVQVLLE